MMTQTDTRLVGNSFKLGYRFQRYWDLSIALAFFFAETGAGLFLVSFYFNFTAGMIGGLVMAGVLKPYFHIHNHKGSSGNSWRAIARPDRSWLSRGLIAIAIVVGFGILHLTGLATRLGLPPAIGSLIGWLAVAGALVVMFYQGMAMSDSESLTLWASALVPVSSFLYALTAGVLLTLATASSLLSGEQQNMLANLGAVLLVADFLAVCAILLRARSKSPGGKFSADLLTQGEYSRYFIGLTCVVGLILPVALLILGGGKLALVAAAAMLAGFLTFRVLLLKAAVFEPIMRGDLIASLGLNR
ncbi:MAG: hypothetical protein LBE62_06800 [Azonexus sp.]|jgi:formate-dependent nitrite reductase membrane component NrfD|nr:hypothetical protein [Azonexus sp.]